MKARRATSAKALQTYEKALAAMQGRKFERAAAGFRGLLDQYPDERELHERSRLYLKVCARERAATAPAPHTFDEWIYAATLALNSGSLDAAMRHLAAASDENADHEHVHYMLSVTQALRGENDAALEHLGRAIELNPDNRMLAVQDPEFDDLRDDERFQQAIEPARVPKKTFEAPGLLAAHRRRPPPIYTLP